MRRMDPWRVLAWLLLCAYWIPMSLIAASLVYALWPISAIALGVIGLCGGAIWAHGYLEWP